VSTDASTHLIKQLDATGAVSIACGAVPRLPTDFLARAAKRPSAVTLAEVAADARWALHVLGLGERFGVASPVGTSSSQLPFQVSLGADGALVVSPDRAVAQNKLLGDQIAHTWARGLLAPGYVIDFVAVDQVNSVLVAWLLQLAQSAKPATMAVRNARPAVLTQFKQLRLDQMMALG
jgi:hypothetical protein